MGGAPCGRSHGEGCVPPINPKHPVVPCHPHPRCHLLMPWCMNRLEIFGVFNLFVREGDMDENMLIFQKFGKKTTN